MFLLDTNVVSSLRRPDKITPELRSWAEAAEPADMFLSAITIFELELGVQRRERTDPAQGADLRLWLDRKILPEFRDRILAVDTVVAARAAGLHVPDPRPDRDSFIAATALVHRLTLVTRNVRDFAPMRLSMVNPWDA